MHSLRKPFMAVAALLLLLPSCDVLEGIYDDPVEQEKSGQGGNSGFTGDDGDDDGSDTGDSTQVTPSDTIATDTTGVEPVYEEQVVFFANYHRGEFTLDCTSYTIWNYLNFHTASYEPTCKLSNINVETQLEDTTYTRWDVAMHRYDVKTNRGAALETPFSSLDEMIASATLPEGTFVEDIEGSVTIDMSHMLDGYLIYQQTMVNREAGKWLDVDTSVMPPVYTLSNKVYLLRFSDGTYLAWYLKDFMNSKSVKGFMHVEYAYPIFETKQVQVN